MKEKKRGLGLSNLAFIILTTPGSAFIHVIDVAHVREVSSIYSVDESDVVHLKLRQT